MFTDAIRVRLLWNAVVAAQCTMTSAEFSSARSGADKPRPGWVRSPATSRMPGRLIGSRCRTQMTSKVAASSVAMACPSTPLAPVITTVPPLLRVMMVRFSEE